jgi:hypothetical protein
MNCPRHLKETGNPEAVQAAEEKRELEELEALLAGNEPEEDYIS